MLIFLFSICGVKSNPVYRLLVVDISQLPRVLHFLKLNVVTHNSFESLIQFKLVMLPSLLRAASLTYKAENDKVRTFVSIAF